MAAPLLRCLFSTVSLNLDQHTRLLGATRTNDGRIASGTCRTDWVRVHAVWFGTTGGEPMDSNVARLPKIDVQTANRALTRFDKPRRIKFCTASSSPGGIQPAICIVGELPCCSLQVRRSPWCSSPPGSPSDTRPPDTDKISHNPALHSGPRRYSTFSASSRCSGGASSGQALAWRCQRRRYGRKACYLFVFASSSLLRILIRKNNIVF